jgi:hypothetical protein
MLLSSLIRYLGDAGISGDHSICLNMCQPTFVQKSLVQGNALPPGSVAWPNNSHLRVEQPGAMPDARDSVFKNVDFQRYRFQESHNAKNLLVVPL